MHDPVCTIFNTTNYDNLKLDLPNELDEPANVLVFISISR